MTRSLEGRCPAHTITPVKDDVIAEKRQLSEELKWKIVSFLAVHINVPKWPVVKKKHVKTEPRMFVLFVSELHDESRSLKSQNIGD